MARGHEEPRGLEWCLRSGHSAIAPHTHYISFSSAHSETTVRFGAQKPSATWQNKYVRSPTRACYLDSFLLTAQSSFLYI